MKARPISVLRREAQVVAIEASLAIHRDALEHVAIDLTTKPVDDDAAAKGVAKRARTLVKALDRMLAK